MNRTPLFLAASAAAVLAFSVSRDARALGPIDVEVGAIAGAGTQPSNQGSGAPNPLGFGLGGRGGVALFGFYGGIEGMYYFGGSDGPFKVHSDLYGVDVGYNLKLPLITIRPLVGIGNFTESSSGSETVLGETVSASGSKSTLYIQPGLTALVSLGTIYVGADANALLLTSLPQPSGGNGLDVAVTIHGQVGLRF